MPEVVDPALERYAIEHSTPEPPLLAEVARATRERFEYSGMMVGPLEGRLLQFLVSALGARRVLEIGTFTGYSALFMAEGLPGDGRIITCEVDPRHAALAREHFAKSPHGQRIELIEGPALATVQQLDGPLDLVFIDADKQSYREYFEAVLPKLAPNGLIAVDNTLWSGRVLADEDRSADTEAIRKFNDALAADPRVEVVQLTVRDGLTLVRRRSG
jgi:caffeoyl-CoA O-methyltransferase